MQVYFIENEDYFPKKTFMHELDGEEFEFHDERAIFFCRGVLETVRKVGMGAKCSALPWLDVSSCSNVSQKSFCRRSYL